MKQKFYFTDTVKRSVFFREWNLCAHCGKSLVNEWDNAHHVLPNQTGSAGNEADEWLRSEENCVMLCDACHGRVHENGNFRTGATALPEYFPYSHGRQTLLHHSWVNRIKKHFV